MLNVYRLFIVPYAKIKKIKTPVLYAMNYTQCCTEN